MSESASAPALVAASLFVVGPAALWIVVAWGGPATTLRLAPLFAAGLLPYAYVTITRRRAGSLLVTLPAVPGTVAVLTTTAILVGAGKLDVPWLLPTGGAALEAAVFSLAGGAFGLPALPRSPAGA